MSIQHDQIAHRFVAGFVDQQRRGAYHVLKFSGLGDRALAKCTDDYEYSEVGQQYQSEMYGAALSGFSGILLMLWGARLWQRNHKFTLKNFFGDTFIAFVGWWVVFWIVARVLLVL